MNRQPLTPLQQQTHVLYPDYKHFIADYVPSQLLALYESVHSIRKSVLETRLAITDICAIYNTDKLNAGIDYINKWLIFLNDLSNINKPLKQTQPVAFMIFSRFSHFYFADLKVLLEKILLGEYGPFYGSVDAQRILTAFAIYDSERAGQIDKINKDAERFVQMQMQALYDKADSEAYASMKGKELDYMEIAKIKDEFRAGLNVGSLQKMEEYRQQFIEQLNSQVK